MCDPYSMRSYNQGDIHGAAGNAIQQHVSIPAARLVEGATSPFLPEPHWDDKSEPGYLVHRNPASRIFGNPVNDKFNALGYMLRTMGGNR